MACSRRHRTHSVGRRLAHVAMWGPSTRPRPPEWRRCLRWRGCSSSWCFPPVCWFLLLGIMRRLCRCRNGGKEAAREAGLSPKAAQATAPARRTSFCTYAKMPKRSAERGEDHIREAFMRIAIAGVFVASTLAATTANAQYAPFNEVGVTMGHWHLASKDAEANKKIFVGMGGQPVAN